jgi:hypothetical protein
MVVLGILMILLAIAAAIAILVNEPATATTITVFGRSFEVSTTQMFVLGVITTALFLIGLALLLNGLRRAGARRKELRYARLEGRDRLARLEEENRDLQRRLQGGAPSREASSREAPPTGRRAAAEEPVRRAEPAAPAEERAGASREGGYAEDRPGYPAGRGAEHTEPVQHRGFIDRLVSIGRHREGTPRR